MNKNALVILQARMSSSRLPGKVLSKINGQPMILWQISRILKSKKVDKLVVATSTDSSDDILCNELEKSRIEFVRGSLEDVISRYLLVLQRYSFYKSIVRLTADCPLIMPNLLDEMLLEFENSDLDYLSNTLTPTYPDGLDVEIFKISALKRLSEMKLTLSEKEHVTLGFRNRTADFKMFNFEQDIDNSDLRWTVDYKEDLEFVKRVFAEFEGNETTFDYPDLLRLLELKPEIENTLSGELRNIKIIEDSKGLTNENF